MTEGYVSRGNRENSSKDVNSKKKSNNNSSSSSTRMSYGIRFVVAFSLIRRHPLYTVGCLRCSPCSASALIMCQGRRIGNNREERAALTPLQDSQNQPTSTGPQSFFAPRWCQSSVEAGGDLNGGENQTITSYHLRSVLVRFQNKLHFP